MPANLPLTKSQLPPLGDWYGNTSRLLRVAILAHGQFAKRSGLDLVVLDTSNPKQIMGSD